MVPSSSVERDGSEERIPIHPSEALHFIDVVSLPGCSPSMEFSWYLVSMAYVSPLVQTDSYASPFEKQEGT